MSVLVVNTCVDLFRMFKKRAECGYDDGTVCTFQSSPAGQVSKTSRGLAKTGVDTPQSSVSSFKPGDRKAGDMGDSHPSSLLSSAVPFERKVDLNSESSTNSRTLNSSVTRGGGEVGVNTESDVRTQLSSSVLREPSHELNDGDASAQDSVQPSSEGRSTERNDAVSGSKSGKEKIGENNCTLSGSSELLHLSSLGKAPDAENDVSVDLSSQGLSKTNSIAQSVAQTSIPFSAPEHSFVEKVVGNRAVSISSAVSKLSAEEKQPGEEKQSVERSPLVLDASISGSKDSDTCPKHLTTVPDEAKTDKTDKSIPQSVVSGISDTSVETSDSEHILQPTFRTGSTDSQAVSSASDQLPPESSLTNGTEKVDIPENLISHATKSEAASQDFSADNSALHEYVTQLFRNFWDDTLERLVHPKKGMKLGIQEALGAGLIPKNIRVVQFKGEDPVGLTEAVASGQVDRRTGRVVNMDNGSVLTVQEALKQGVFVVDRSLPGDSVEASQALATLRKELGQGLFEKIRSGHASMAVQVTDRRTGKKFEIHDAVAHSMLNVDTAHVKDMVSGKWFSWEDGQRAGIISDPRRLSLHQLVLSPHFRAHLENFSDPAGYSLRPLTLEEMVEQDFVDVTKHEVFDALTEKWMTVEDAIARNVIDPIQNKYFHKKIGKLISLHDAVDSGLIGPHHEENASVLADSGEVHTNGVLPEDNIRAWEEVQLEDIQLPVAIFEALSAGRFDTKTSDVIMSAGRRLSFQSAYEKDLLQAQGTFIVDRCTGVMYSFKEAVNCGLVEVKTGCVYDTATGKKLSLAVAKDQGLIKDTPQPLLPLSVAAEFELFDFEEKKIRHPETKQSLTLTQAIAEGIVDPSSQLSTPSGDKTTLQQVITDGTLNLETLVLTFPDGRSQSLERCLGVEGNKQPNTYEFGRKMSLTLDEAITSGVYDPVSNSVRSRDSFISLSKALKTGMINTDSLVRDPYSGDILSLKEALDKRIIDQDCGKMIDTEGVPIALNFAMEKGLILKSKAPLNLSLSEALDEGLFNVISNQFLNPDSNEEIDFVTALDQGILDTEFIRVRNTLTGEIVSFDTAVNEGLLDMNGGTCINMEDGEEYSIVDGMDKGIIIDTSSQPALNLEEALDEGILDVETCTFKDPFGQFSLSLRDAMESGLLNRFSISVRDLKNKTLLSLDGAVSQGLVDSTTGAFKKNDDEDMAFREALEKGLIFSDMCVPDKSLLDVVKQGLYNPKSCKFTDPSTGKVRTLRDMVRDDLVDPQLVVVLDKGSQQLLTYWEAVDAKVLDAKRGLVVDTGTGELLDLKEAMGRGLLQENLASIAVSLKQAVDTGLLHKSHGRIVDPLSRKQLVVEDAISIGLIDVSRLLVRNQDKDLYQFMEESTNDGVVFVDEDSIVYARSGSAVDVVTAFKENLLVEIPQNGFLLGDILSSGLYDEMHKRFKDPLTGRTLTLTEAISSGVINADLPQVAVPGLGKFSLVEAIDKGLIDPNTGDYIALDKPLSLFDAILTGRVSALSGSSPALRKDERKSISVKTDFCQPHRDESAVDGMEVILVTDKGAKKVRSLKPSEMEVIPRNTYSRGQVSDPSESENETSHSSLSMKSSESDLNTTDFVPKRHSVTQMSDSFSASWTDSPQSSISEDQMNTSQSDIPYTAAPFLPHMKCHSASNLLDAAAESKRISRDLELASPSLGELHKTSMMRPDKSMTMSDSLMEIHSTQWNPPTDELSASLDSLILDAIRKQHIEEKPIPLFDIIKYGIYEEKSGTFHDPETDEIVGLTEAISTGLLDDSLREVINPNTRQPVSLAEAVQTGVIDAETCRFVDESTGTRLSLQQAVDVGLIFKEKESKRKPVDIYVEEVLPDSSTTGRKKLEEAFSNGILHRSNSQVIDPDSITAITLRRAASLGLIDVKTGEFKNPQTGESMSLAQAVEKGFILSPKGLTLYNAVNQGLYVESTGLFLQPSTGDTKTLKDLIQDDVVSSVCLEVKDLGQDSIISLGEAIKRGVIDDQKGLYLCKDRSVKYNLTEAVAAGLIVSTNARDGLSDVSRSSLSPSPVPFYIDAADAGCKPVETVLPFRKSLSDPGHATKQTTLSPAGSHSSQAMSSLPVPSAALPSTAQSDGGPVAITVEERLGTRRSVSEQDSGTVRLEEKGDLSAMAKENAAPSSPKQQHRKYLQGKTSYGQDEQKENLPEQTRLTEENMAKSIASKETPQSEKRSQDAENHGDVLAEGDKESAKAKSWSEKTSRPKLSPEFDSIKPGHKVHMKESEQDLIRDSDRRTSPVSASLHGDAIDGSKKVVKPSSGLRNEDDSTLSKKHELLGEQLEDQSATSSSSGKQQNVKAEPVQEPSSAEPKTWTVSHGAPAQNLHGVMEIKDGQLGFSTGQEGHPHGMQTLSADIERSSDAGGKAEMSVGSKHMEFAESGSAPVDNSEGNDWNEPLSEKKLFKDRMQVGEKQVTSLTPERSVGESSQEMQDVPEKPAEKTQVIDESSGQVARSDASQALPTLTSSRDYQDTLMPGLMVDGSGGSREEPSGMVPLAQRQGPLTMELSSNKPTGVTQPGSKSSPEFTGIVTRGKEFDDSYKPTTETQHALTSVRENQNRPAPGIHVCSPEKIDQSALKTGTGNDNAPVPHISMASVEEQPGAAQFEHEAFRDNHEGLIQGHSADSSGTMSGQALPETAQRPPFTSQETVTPVPHTGSEKPSGGSVSPEMKRGIHTEVSLSDKSLQLTVQSHPEQKSPTGIPHTAKPGVLVSDGQVPQQVHSVLKQPSDNQEIPLAGVLVSSSDGRPSPKPKRNQRVRFKDIGPEDTDETSSTATTDSTDTLEGWSEDTASKAALRASVQRKGLTLDVTQVSSQADSDASTPEAEAQKLTDMLFKFNLKSGSTARERRKVGLAWPLPRLS